MFDDIHFFMELVNGLEQKTKIYEQLAEKYTGVKLRQHTDYIDSKLKKWLRSNAYEHGADSCRFSKMKVDDEVIYHVDIFAEDHTLPFRYEIYRYPSPTLPGQ